MDKILVEEDRLKKRKKQQPHLWTDPKSDKSKVITYSSGNYFKIRGFISKYLDIPKQRKYTVLTFVYSIDHNCMHCTFLFLT